MTWKSRLRLSVVRSGPRTGPAGVPNRGWRTAGGPIEAFIGGRVADTGSGHHLVKILLGKSALAGGGSHQAERPPSGFYYHTVDGPDAI